MKACCLGVALFFTMPVLLHAQKEAPLRLVRTIPLPALHAGDMDHFRVDLTGQRLFLAAEENEVVEVIDLRTGKLVDTIRGGTTPHSMAYDPDAKKLFVANEGPPNQVEIYDGTSFKPLGTIPTKGHTDASVYDPTNKFYYVGNGGKDDKEDYCLVTIIDTTSGKKVGDIKIDDDRIEGMAIENSGRRMFVNMYDKSRVAVIDREKRKVVDTWLVGTEGKGSGLSSMVFDEADHRLFVVTRDPEKKVVALDSDSGQVVVSLPTATGMDDLGYDPGSKRLYASGIDFLEVYQQKDPDHYERIGQIPNSFRAKTALLVPQLKRYYVAVPRHGNQQAEVRVYEVN
jgi:DNA-binding beta-propeller fold protein YncE